ncbi:acetyltransferase family protein [Listeria grandensis FSL F6-0971]|uniref:Acetyltransferase family protein n=1 Tax=Listeria grandensis FSL F6-0971 TaxID=1265819 RepID=W7B5M4_9LIST|nr:GNAT family protein [Listeria grandensis]EUJ22604.1 acetyltransferase family protein [Listeria grandensis FSL F6-0971]MBC6316491.1 GNAT family N-acetyltransferase [Listeria grandensis]
MTVTLQKFIKEASQTEALRNYTLENDTFCAHPLTFLDREGYHCVLVCDNEEVVGFFVLDNGPDLATYVAEPHALLLRGYSIDSTMQGQGYGTRSLAELKAYVNAHFTMIDQVVLAVNKRNIPAQKLYLKSGFRETARTVLGPRGEQFVYEMKM